MTEQWIKFLHELATTIGALAAVLAAASSLRNGRTLKESNGTIKEMADRRRKKKTQNGDSKDDWYQPPTLH